MRISTGMGITRVKTRGVASNYINKRMNEVTALHKKGNKTTIIMFDCTEVTIENLS